MRSPESSAALASRVFIQAELLRRRKEELDAEQAYRSAVDRRLEAERAYTASGVALTRIEAEDTGL